MEYIYLKHTMQYGHLLCFTLNIPNKTQFKLLQIINFKSSIRTHKNKMCDYLLTRGEEH